MFDEPVEIQKARKLLSDFESSSDHSERVDCFENAMKTLNKYMEDNQNSELNQRVIIIKKTYTRKLIEQLDMFSKATDPAEHGIYYLAIIVQYCFEELKTIKDENQNLNDIWMNFLKRYEIEFL